MKATERRGRPSNEIVVNCSQFEPGRKSREIAAEKAGFGSHMTYRRAKRVVEKGAPELVDAMDAGGPGFVIRLAQSFPLTSFTISTNCLMASACGTASVSVSFLPPSCW